MPDINDKLPIYDRSTVRKLLNKDTLDIQEEIDDINSDPRQLYIQYARREIEDFSSIPPFMESDKQQRNPNQARERLNIRYNSTRGNSKNLPIHPEMFVGFTDADPRGTNDQPNMALMRNHIWGVKNNPYENRPYDGAEGKTPNPLFRGGRAARLEVSMGNNDENHVAERPKSGIENQIDRVERQIWVRDRFKDFTPQHNGQSTNQNTGPKLWPASGVRLDNETLRDEFYIDNIIRSEGTMRTNKTPLNKFNSNSFECTPVNTPEQITQNRQRVIAEMVKNSNEYVTYDQGAGKSLMGDNKKQTIAVDLNAIQSSVAQQLPHSKSLESKVAGGLMDSDNVGKIYRYSKHDARVYTPAEMAENRQLAIVLKERNNGFDTVTHNQMINKEGKEATTKKVRFDIDVRANADHAVDGSLKGKMYEQMASKVRTGVDDDMIKAKFQNIPDAVKNAVNEHGFVSYKSLAPKIVKLTDKTSDGQEYAQNNTSKMRRRKMLAAVKAADVKPTEMQKGDDYMVPRQVGGGTVRPKSLRTIQMRQENNKLKE